MTVKQNISMEYKFPQRRARYLLEKERYCNSGLQDYSISLRAQENIVI